MASCTISFHPFAQGTVTTGEAVRMWGRLQFIRLLGVAMFEIERRADVFARF